MLNYLHQPVDAAAHRENQHHVSTRGSRRPQTQTKNGETVTRSPVHLSIMLPGDKLQLQSEKGKISKLHFKETQRLSECCLCDIAHSGKRTTLEHLQLQPLVPPHTFSFTAFHYSHTHTHTHFCGVHKSPHVVTKNALTSKLKQMKLRG